MKIIIFSIIALVLSLTFSLASAQENGTTVYFMKPDSPAKLYLNITFVPNWSVQIYPFMYKYPEINNLYGNQSFSIIPTPSSVQNTQQSSYNVTYTISAKSNIAGTFELFTGGCTTSSFIPLVIGLNESQVNPQIYRNFHSGWVSLSCPPNSALFKEIKITSYSGLIPKVVSENSNTWINPTQSSTIPEFPLVIPILIICITSFIIMSRHLTRRISQLMSR